MHLRLNITKQINTFPQKTLEKFYFYQTSPYYSLEKQQSQLRNFGSFIKVNPVSIKNYSSYLKV